MPPSVTVTSSITTFAESLSVIVPKPVASAIVTKPLLILLKSTLKVSVSSTNASSVVTTLMVCVSPAVPVKVNVPLVAV